MKAVSALRQPIGVDMSGFVRLLRQLQIPFRVTEEAGEQVFWVPDQALAAEVQRLYASYPDGAEPLAGAASAAPAGAGVAARLRSARLTVAVLLVTLLVAGITLLGDNYSTVRWFSFSDFSIHGDYAHFVPLADSLAAGQWWRLVTPMLVHFGLLHLAMNALWYWELGRRVEARQGAVALLALTLLFALASNLAQYLASGAGLFGGLSGVLYGLLGHCWLMQKLAPDPRMQLPRGVVAMLLIWLVVCLSGLVSLLGFGAIANAAHVGGLLTGCVTGLAGGWFARRR